MGTHEAQPELSSAHSHGIDVDGIRREVATMDTAQLRCTVMALLDELAQSDAASSVPLQEEMMARLRTVNENLVLATLNAQSLQEEAEAANRRQNEFLAMLAHELRNPLAPISMAAALLKRTPDAPPQLVNLHSIISRQVQHMARLLDDLLDAARISSGKITLTMSVIPLAEVIERAVETIQPRIDERRQKLIVERIAADVLVEGDPVRLTQIFSNLLSNASRYTRDAGEIAFFARMAEDNQVMVSVEDNGEGIPTDVMPHIFDLFVQGPRSLARSEGGLGVGLNVVRNLVHMHGGKVEASSAGAGRGSRFTVTLPVTPKQRAADASSAPAVEPGRRCRVLVIEDNVDACQMLESFLEIHGHDAMCAHDGNVGLAMALRAPFDVLICDIGLPELDGFSIIAQLRQAQQDVRTFAIALSGYGQAEDRERALAAGFDRYFVKPVDPAMLIDAIAAA